MGAAPDGPRGRGPRGGMRPYLVALALTVVLPAAVGIAVWAALPDTVGPGRCEGVGFGCVPSPATTFALWGLAVGLPAALVVSAAACVAIALRRSRRRSDR